MVFIFPANWDRSTGLKALWDASSRSGSYNSQIWETLLAPAKWRLPLPPQHDENHRGNLWMVKALLHEWYFCLIILCCKPLSLHLLLHIWMPNKLQNHSKSCHVCFDFHSKCILDVYPPPRSPFTRRLGLVLNATNWPRLLTPLLKPLLPESHTLSLHDITICVSLHWAPASVSTL